MIKVTDTDLVAGKARIPITAIGEVTAHHGESARMERGQRLDARAWLLIRGWVDPVVKLEVRDEADPTPYWLVSTRKPEAIIAALADLRRRTPDK